MSQNEQKIERGKEAILVESVVAPLIQKRVDTIISHMVAMYRGGDIDHDRLVGKVAEITAMYNLISDLESVQRQGDIAAEKEFGSATEK